jgi:hypothetical protein
LPEGRLLCSEVGGGQALLAGVVFINPRREIFAAKLRKGEQKIGEIALRDQ